MRISKVISFFLVSAVLATPWLSSAQEPGPFTNELLEIIKRINRWMTAILLVVAVTFVVYAAYLYLSSQGDPEKVKTANRVILYAAVAVAVALLAYVFIAVVQALVRPGAAGTAGSGAAGGAAGGGSSPYRGGAPQQVPF